MNSTKFSRSQNSSKFLIVAMVILALTAVAAPCARAQATETILYSFIAGADGYNPVGGLVSDGAGNLYGTSNNGGDYTYGTLFELSPQAGGGWTEKVLHSFNWHTDGAFPAGTLIFDAAGNLYGTTSLGGAHDAGSVFEFSPKAGGLWTETILHQFGNGKDGAEPLAGLTFDAAGNLYGTTNGGGNASFGTVFELSPKAGSGWTEKILHNFDKNGLDGFYPSGSVTLDAAGNVYGTTQRGGSKNGGGVVFELVHQTGGAWAEKLLFTFEYGGKSPYRPYAGLTFDSAGNLFGTTFAGGLYAFGTVFELTPTAGGHWTANLLYSFNPTGDSGDQPESNLVIDAAGNLYGTANRGGANGVGTVFELSPQADGPWTETTLHTFNNTNADGYQPMSGLTLDSAGNLYGTTLDGGATGAGTVFKITP